MSASHAVRALHRDRDDSALEQAALSRAVLDSIDVGIVACDRYGRVTTFNRVCRDFHGMDADATVDQDRLAEWFSLYDTDGVTLLEPDRIPLLRALRGESVQEVEIVIAPHGLERRLVTCTGRRIHAPDGTLLGAVASMRDITARRAVERALQARTLHDPLTGLPNRDLLAERVERARSGAAGEPRTTALLFIDLDGFKTVNDLHGHTGGDQLLCQVGERLRVLIRGTDTAARLGADEFVVMCPGLALGNRSDATALAERLLHGLSHPYRVGNTVVRVSASIGIAYGDGDSVDAGELIARSDAAMYLAKRAGRARHATYDHDTTTSVRQASREAARIERLLRGALDRDELTVHYQPVVALDTGALVGTEALARLRDRDGAMVPPSAFIPVAERCGLIGRLGDAVLHQAVHQTAAWKRLLRDDHEFAVGVNVSVRQLGQPALLDSVRSELSSSGLPADALVLELTESVFSDADEHIDMLAALRRLGPRLTIDDFGTGSSSLSYLRRFVVDCVKVDRSFVADLGDDRNDRVTRAVVQMAVQLGLPVIAEGIETVEQLSVLRALGCRLGQGYLLARPMPADEITRLLRRGPRALRAP